MFLLRFTVAEAVSSRFFAFVAVRIHGTTEHKHGEMHHRPCAPAYDGPKVVPQACIIRNS